MSFNIEWTNADAFTPKQFTVYESVPVTYSTTTAPFGDLQREVRAGSSEVRVTATVKLLPCPFCGGEAHIITAVGESWVICEKCRATTEMHASKQLAIAAWNRRADHD